MPTTTNPRDGIRGWTSVEHARWLHTVAAQLDLAVAYDPWMRCSSMGEDASRVADDIRALAADICPCDSEASLPF